MIFLVLLIGALLTGVTYQKWATQRDRQRLQPPGRSVRTELGVLYLHEQGQGSPTVLLESGLAASSLSWALVQPQIAEWARVCSYDRAGFGWSSPGATPRTVGHVLAELKSLLRAAGLQPPFLLVGHSYGGLLVSAFAHSYPEDVAGVVLVDPVSVRYWSECGPIEKQRLRLGARLSRRGALLARLGFVRLALLLLARGSTRFPQWMARASSGKAHGLVTRLAGEVRRLPPTALPFLRAHWSRACGFQTMAAYLENLPRNAQEAAQMEIPATIPVTILSAASATDDELQERERWAKQSRRGRHIRLNRGGHWIQLEQPEAVVDTIRELIELIRPMPDAALK